KLSKFEELAGQGKTTMILVVDQKIEGMIAVADTIKESSKEAVLGLQKMGLEVIMLTGDNNRTAAAIAEELGIKRYFAEVLPTAKSEVIKELQTKEKKKIAMVGD